MKPRHYLFLASLAYSFPVLRPLQQAIRQRGDRVAWFVDEPYARTLLTDDEEELVTPQEVIEYNPIAVFTCGNYMYDFFPGIKVQLFHGYPINKRNDKRDDHFSIRGWFDMYCTQGPSSTIPFKQLEQKLGYFRTYETGWPKADTYFCEASRKSAQNNRPVILYSTTFTPSLSSTSTLAHPIEEMIDSNNWEWIFMFHPKLLDANILSRYEAIASRHDNVTFLGGAFSAEAMQRADVMLCDSSSIILEFMFLDKPVVTFCNSQPGNHLINVEEASEVENAIKLALTYPPNLMQHIADYTLQHEAHRDCQCSQRVLNSVDDFINRGYKGLRRKPLNIIRKWQVRRKLGYFPCIEKLRQKLRK